MQPAFAPNPNDCEQFVIFIDMILRVFIKLYNRILMYLEVNVLLNYYHVLILMNGLIKNHQLI